MIQNPYFPLADGAAAKVPVVNDGPVMWGITADRPVASAAHLGWFYFDTTTGTLYACTFENTTGFAWVQVAAADTAPLMVSVPTATGDPGTKGQMALDANFLYVCHATDTWYRLAKGAIF